MILLEALVVLLGRGTGTFTGDDEAEGRQPDNVTANADIDAKTGEVLNTVLTANATEEDGEGEDTTVDDSGLLANLVDGSNAGGEDSKVDWDV